MEIEYVHFYVDDALTWRQWFVDRFGFWSAGSWQDDDSHHERVCSGSVRFLLSSALSPASPIARYLELHPPGVVDVALRVEDLEALLLRARKLGATVVSDYKSTSSYEASRLAQSSQAESSQAGSSQVESSESAWAKISGWGALQHTLVEAKAGRTISEEASDFCESPSSAPMLPPQLRWPAPQSSDAFLHIDHVVLNVAAGALNQAVQWYSKLLALRSRQSFHIRTPYSGLRSQVLVGDSLGANGNQLLQFPINEPESTTSQIQDFLDRNRGPGIQHIALGTQALLPTVAALRQQQIDFLAVPPSYYRQLRLRPQFEAQGLSQDWDEIVTQQVLVDWHPDRLEGPLLQIFTRPIFAEPTFFFELIERRQTQSSSVSGLTVPRQGLAEKHQPSGKSEASASAHPMSAGGCAQGFGEGNFQALFEAMELEQRSRALSPKP